MLYDGPATGCAALAASLVFASAVAWRVGVVAGLVAFPSTILALVLIAFVASNAVHLYRWRRNAATATCTSCGAAIRYRDQPRCPSCGADHGVRR